MRNALPDGSASFRPPDNDRQFFCEHLLFGIDASTAVALGLSIVYDLGRAQRRCIALGLAWRRPDEDWLQIELDDGVHLHLCNAETARSGVPEVFPDGIMTLDGSDSHCHGDPCFSSDSWSLEMGYLDMLDALADGSVLVGERWKMGVLLDRMLVHCEVHDLFDDLAPTEEARAWRARTQSPSARRLSLVSAADVA